MRTLAVGLLMLGSTVLGWASQAPPGPAESVDLLLPEEGGRVRLCLTLEGQALAARWEAFLDRWFDYFDRDGSGWISRPEAARILTLPAAESVSLAFDFERADTDKDGKVSRGELKAFYRRGGFTPVRAVVEAPALRDLQVSEALFRHLGPAPDGKLTRARLRRAGELLRKLDEDEDEVLTKAEVLSLGAPVSLPAPPPSRFRWARATGRPVSAIVHLALGNPNGPQVHVEGGGKPDLQALVTAGSAAPRVRCGSVVLAFSYRPEEVAKAAVQARQFLVAQFKNISGSKSWVEKTQVAEDASLQILADVFAHADRDGDGKLTLTELDHFLALLEQGAVCSFTVRLTDTGRNLFAHLDTNGDGRLDVKELKAAARQLTALDGAKEWTRSQIPYFAQVTVLDGQGGSSFGPLPLLTLPPAAPAARPPLTNKGPAWFRAMDTNGDGYLSPAEFLGSAERFRQLDRDGDGLISVEEAERAPTSGPGSRKQ
jgi:Ca2+-binding EF-hand superfamily protein